MNRTTIKLIITGLILGFLAGFIGYYLMPQYWPRPREGLVQNFPRYKVHASYAADYSNDQILMGASHNVFVARIIREIEVRDYYTIPNTMFEVEIIANVKGNLQGHAVVGQEGGLKNGMLYLMDNGVKFEDYFLKPGNTYLLATRYSPGGNWHLLNFHSNARKLINKEDVLFDELTEIAKDDNKVKNLKEAYKNEILLEADIKHNNILNSYKSLQEKQK